MTNITALSTATYNELPASRVYYSSSMTAHGITDQGTAGPDLRTDSHADMYTSILPDCWRKSDCKDIRWLIDIRQYLQPGETSI